MEGMERTHRSQKPRCIFTHLTQGSWRLALGRGVVGNTILPPPVSHTSCPTCQQILLTLPSKSLSTLIPPQKLHQASPQPHISNLGLRLLPSCHFPCFGLLSLCLQGQVALPPLKPFRTSSPSPTSHRPSGLLYTLGPSSAPTFQPHCCFSGTPSTCFPLPRSPTPHAPSWPPSGASPSTGPPFSSQPPGTASLLPCFIHPEARVTI